MISSTNRSIRKTIKRFARNTAAVLLVSVLAACGNGFAGEYGHSVNGKWETIMTFKGNGEVELDMMGNTMVGKYEVKDGKVYITGGNPTTARLLGINADRVTIIGYIISGGLAAVAGLVLSGYVGIVDNWVGRGFELDSIVAAVMGGISLAGGRGGIIGGLFGAAVLIVVFNAVLLFGLPVQFQIIIKGIVIVAAAAFYVRRTN